MNAHHMVIKAIERWHHRWRLRRHIEEGVICSLIIFIARGAIRRAYLWPDGKSAAPARRSIGERAAVICGAIPARFDKRHRRH